MKSLFLTIVFFLCGFSFAKACEFQINGKDVAPVPLRQGQSVPLNEGDDNKTVLVTCEPFTGTVQGMNRIQRLNPSQCTIVSNKTAFTLFECEGGKQSLPPKSQTFVVQDQAEDGVFDCVHAASADVARWKGIDQCVHAGFYDCKELGETANGYDAFCGTASVTVTVIGNRN